MCIVATAGTTASGSIDPLAEIARIAADEGLWLHVDAAYGGALRFSRVARARLNGIERANSITFNPHKWFFVARNCSMVLFRDHRSLDRGFGYRPTQGRPDRGARDISNTSIHGTQHADVVKLWLSLLHFGRAGLSRLVDHGLGLGKRLAEEIDRRPYLELAMTPDTNIVCFRPAPGCSSAELSDRAWIGQLQRDLLRDEQIFLSLQPLSGRHWLRSVTLNPFSGEDQVQRLLAWLERQLDSHHQPGG